MTVRRFVLVSLLALLTVSSAEGEPSIATLRAEEREAGSRVNDARRELERLDAELAELSSRSRLNGERLGIARLRLRRAEADLELQRARVAEVSLSLERLSREIEERSGRLVVDRARLGRRVNLLFRRTRLGTVETLLSARDSVDLALRNRILAAVAAADARLVKRTLMEKSSLEARHSELEEEYERQREIEADLASARAEASRARNELEALERELSLQRRETEERLSETRAFIESTERRLRELRSEIERLSRVYAAPGRFMRPLSGELYTDQAVSGEAGIYIRAPFGTAVAAAADGEVISVRSFRGLGTTIIVGHGGGYQTIYGNLSSAVVETGRSVKAGDRLGLSGRSPSGEMLYFAVYRNGSPRNTSALLGF